MTTAYSWLVSPPPYRGVWKAITVVVRYLLIAETGTTGALPDVDGPAEWLLNPTLSARWNDAEDALRRAANETNRLGSAGFTAACEPLALELDVPIRRRRVEWDVFLERWVAEYRRVLPKIRPAP